MLPQLQPPRSRFFGHKLPVTVDGYREPRWPAFRTCSALSERLQPLQSGRSCRPLRVMADAVGGAFWLRGSPVSTKSSRRQRLLDPAISRAQVLNRRFGRSGVPGYNTTLRAGAVTEQPTISNGRLRAHPRGDVGSGYDLLTGWSKRWSKNAPFFFLRLPTFAGVFFVKSTS